MNDKVSYLFQYPTFDFMLFILALGAVEPHFGIDAYEYTYIRQNSIFSMFKLVSIAFRFIVTADLKGGCPMVKVLLLFNCLTKPQNICSVLRTNF